MRGRFGESVETFQDHDGSFGREILKCVHCGRRWEVEPGSGRERGWCMLHNGPTCGQPECEQRSAEYHLDEMQWVEVAEGTRRPGGVLVPVGVDLS